VERPVRLRSNVECRSPEDDRPVKHSGVRRIEGNDREV
jgi:hypothetical protein